MDTTQPPSSRTLVLNVGQASSAYLVTELPAPPGTTAKRVRNTAHVLIQSLPCALELATAALLYDCFGSQLILSFCFGCLFLSHFWYFGTLLLSAVSTPQPACLHHM